MKNLSIKRSISLAISALLLVLTNNNDGQAAEFDSEVDFESELHIPLPDSTEKITGYHGINDSRRVYLLPSTISLAGEKKTCVAETKLAPDGKRYVDLLIPFEYFSEKELAGASVGLARMDKEAVAVPLRITPLTIETSIFGQKISAEPSNLTEINGVFWGTVRLTPSVLKLIGFDSDGDILSVNITYKVAGQKKVNGHVEKIDVTFGVGTGFSRFCAK